MSVSYSNLFQTGQIAGVKMRNRIVMSPATTSFWGINGEVTDRVIEHYATRAKGGAALITVSVDLIDYPPGNWSFGARFKPGFVPGHYRLVNACHNYGAKVSYQICHIGRQAFNPPGVETVSCSKERCTFLNQIPLAEPRPLNEDEIYHIMDLFADTAANCKRAGYDFIEIHGAHGYLVCSFMSPRWNKRTDKWGGSLENRMRFPIELFKRMKEKTGHDYPIGIRISADEMIEGGITVNESPIMAHMLEEAGVAYINISAATYETEELSNDITRLPEDWKSYIWKAVSKAVSIPTFAAGNIRDPEFAEKIISEGMADYVALARALWCDPEWPNKAKAGRSEDIRKCISCLRCWEYLTWRGAGDACCALNVAVGQEKQFGEIKPALTKKKVAIIGAGPGGMEAARVAALRGHDVILYDKEKEIGGQVLIAAKPPGKDKYLWIRDYYATQLKKLKVKIQLNTEMTPTLIEETKPDAVIVAIGAVPLIPDIPGIKNNKVITAQDVLLNKVVMKNQKVAVIGGGVVGSEVAEFLADRGNTVTIIEKLPLIAADMEILNRQGLIAALTEKKVSMLTKQVVTEVVEKGVVITDSTSGEKKVVEADWIVLAMGAKPLTTLADTLEGKVPEVYAIGDCKEPRTLMAAIHEGAFTASQLLGSKGV